MPPNPTTPLIRVPLSEKLTRGVIGSLSVFTMLMTVPQVLTIWIGRRAAGISLFSWGSYLISAVLWLWYGVRKRDRNIYLPCIGWIVLDAAVIVGAFLYG